MGKERVNPPRQVELPNEIKNNPSLKKAFDDAYYIMFQMWKRLGGGTDLVDESISTLNEFETKPKHDFIEQSKDEVIFTIIDHLTTGNETVICDNKLTVTLNDEPDDRELVKVHTRNGRVDIKGNGKKINKEDDAIIRRDFTTWNFVYIVEIDEWVII